MEINHKQIAENIIQNINDKRRKSVSLYEIKVYGNFELNELGDDFKLINLWLRKLRGDNFDPDDKSLWRGWGKDNLLKVFERKEPRKTLTKEQFDLIKGYLTRLQHLLSSGETFCFDNEYDLNDSKEIEELIKKLDN